MMHYSWHYLADWTGRMAEKHGGTVYDKNGKTWDWGQALCREMHGAEWMTDPDYLAINEIPATEPAPKEVVDTARRWLDGEIRPDWIVE